jgi:hypothetical protein
MGAGTAADLSTTAGLLAGVASQLEERGPGGLCRFRNMAAAAATWQQQQQQKRRLRLT